VACSGRRASNARETLFIAFGTLAEQLEGELGQLLLEGEDFGF
jgi:hypothetical protein